MTSSASYRVLWSQQARDALKAMRDKVQDPERKLGLAAR